MVDAVIVSTARTGIGKAYRGWLNNTEGATLAGHVIGEAVSRAGIQPAEVEDVVMGCAMQQGTTGTNIARKGAIRAGLPVTAAAPPSTGNARPGCSRLPSRLGRWCSMASRWRSRAASSRSAWYRTITSTSSMRSTMS